MYDKVSFDKCWGCRYCCDDDGGLYCHFKEGCCFDAEMGSMSRKEIMKTLSQSLEDPINILADNFIACVRTMGAEVKNYLIDVLSDLPKEKVNEITAKVAEIMSITKECKND